MNKHLPKAIREALAPWSPPPSVDSLNDDDTYVVDLRNNCVVRQCSAGLARCGIPVTLGHAVMKGMDARHHIEREAARRNSLGGV